MAVFDIDDTILEASQRFKDARRAGLIDKEGKPVKKRAIETPGKAFKRKEDFLYDPKNLQKDKVVPGALEFIRELMAEGYVIAYCTGRLYTHREVTRTQLESNGFPIMRDAEGEELLFLNSRRGTSTRNYKLQTLTTLNSKYDIRMFFDDQTDNLSSAASVGIPGIYAKISDYTKYKTRSNPGEYIIREGSDEEEETLDPSGYGFYGSVPSNPGSLELKVQAILIKEGGAAGLKPLKAAFPKRTTKAQAVEEIAKMSSVYQHPAGDYILKDETVRANGLSLADTLRELEEEKEKRRMGGKVTKFQKSANEHFDSKGNPPLNCGCGKTPCMTFGGLKNPIRSNPPKNKIEKGKKLYEHMNGKAPEKVEKKKIDMGDVWYQVGEGGCWQIGYMSGKETGKTEQKYTHTFNEETKDGNFPKLYATMPENGKPLLIIQGGTWKIRTDDKGVAWIYD